jgi:hypothetical protein
MTLTPSGDRTTVARGDGWTVDLDLEDPGSARIVVTDGDGQVVSDQALPAWEPLEPGESIPARAIVDPVAREFAVIVDGHALFLPASVVSTSPIETTREAARSELCERLLERL